MSNLAMRGQITGGAIAIVAVLVALVAWMSLYTVPQTQFALPLAWPADPRDDAFLISDSNARAAHLLDRHRLRGVRDADVA